jgi:hypothetical protein
MKDVNFFTDFLIKTVEVHALTIHLNKTTLMSVLTYHMILLVL